eukprot:scaffold192586_cov37-Prasinocladus_malaysianus.AAC.1
MNHQQFYQRSKVRECFIALSKPWFEMHWSSHLIQSILQVSRGAVCQLSKGGGQVLVALRLSSHAQEVGGLLRQARVAARAAVDDNPRQQPQHAQQQLGVHRPQDHPNARCIGASGPVGAH